MPTSEEIASLIEANKKNLAKAKDLLDNADDYLTQWERSFLYSIESWLKRSSANALSTKQQEVLDRVASEIPDRMAD